MLRGIGVLFEAPPLYRGALHLSPKMHGTKNVSLLSKDAFYDKGIPFSAIFSIRLRLTFTTDGTHGSAGVLCFPPFWPFLATLFSVARCHSPSFLRSQAFFVLFNILGTLTRKGGG